MKDLFTATSEESEIIERIANRAIALYRKYGNTELDEVDIMMDLMACHCNGCPLRLSEMEQADVDLRPEDIEMQVYRSSGAGGQPVSYTHLTLPTIA